MKICKGWLQALLSSAPRGFAARSRVLARLVSLAQIGELARRLQRDLTEKKRNLHEKEKPRRILVVVVNDPIMQMAYSRA